MSRIRIRHTTGYRYEQPAVASYNESRMLPSTSDGQFVIYSNLDIRPNTSINTYEDYWGTKVVSFDVLAPHTELQLTATSLVEVRPRLTGGHDLSWEQLEKVASRATQHVEQLGQTVRTRPTDDLVRASQEIKDASSSPGAAASAIARMVGEEMEYMSGVTHVHTLASEAWTNRKGVCQDIAHITIGALRAVGIPARYVSGYLHPRPNAQIGETIRGESHAWVEWFTGEWNAWDPTNLIDIGERHVKVGLGRDYNDVPPLRGVYAGAGKSQLFVSVEITKES
ncbi:transglutaminase N-terminal domain-containing protein [Agrococcus sediminis]|uniref:transglutaminase family protein n=1 Tax=Agrococcus TaxID=46352 RepID=UPI000FE4139C|nr:transglutaminase family protein [Agrococcus sp. BE272]MDR7233669.1 transglutaminase-like putative cysteine protease [Agrococcus sp. BE272]RWR24951.1 transglutaminase family protein [Agrococcus lahaulensis]